MRKYNWEMLGISQSNLDIETVWIIKNRGKYWKADRFVLKASSAGQKITFLASNSPFCSQNTLRWANNHVFCVKFSVLLSKHAPLDNKTRFLHKNTVLLSKYAPLDNKSRFWHWNRIVCQNTIKCYQHLMNLGEIMKPPVRNIKTPN